MGFFKKKIGGNELDELTGPVKKPRQDVFHGTIEDIKANPKIDKNVPDQRLEDLNRQVFF